MTYELTIDQTAVASALAECGAIEEGDITADGKWVDTLIRGLEALPVGAITMTSPSGRILVVCPEWRSVLDNGDDGGRFTLEVGIAPAGEKNAVWGTVVLIDGGDWAITQRALTAPGVAQAPDGIARARALFDWTLAAATEGTRSLAELLS
ncbi:hypothetical protein [Nocardia sp. NPDC052566]|uniref:hypothetical protein n=1 Tax=Nocardia sp. NPDC052566 TaxID=3364330 RepID=UPI0037CA2986